MHLEEFSCTTLVGKSQSQVVVQVDVKVVPVKVVKLIPTADSISTPQLHCQRLQACGMNDRVWLSILGAC